MNPWEIWEFPIPSIEEHHPFVIISHPDICTNPRFKSVNGLMCTSISSGDALRSFEAMLNGADGLDRETAVDCSFIHALKKSSVLAASRRGVVTPERRRAIVKRINAVFRFNAV